MEIRSCRGVGEKGCAHFLSLQTVRKEPYGKSSESPIPLQAEDTCTRQKNLNIMTSLSTSPAWLDRPILKDTSKVFTIENLLVTLILILAIISRFAALGERVMSHDEVNHVVPSYELYQGRGYRHDPVTHGPFQFHAIALSYFLFGDSDFTSRVPAAVFSVAAVAFVLFGFRRYLGRAGALIAGTLFLISPYLLFYGRYTRNEAFIELLAVVLLYGILRYMEKGDRLGMFLVTISTAMHFIVKETAFIYTAEALIFLFVLFLVEVRRAMRSSPAKYNRFLLLMGAAMLLVIVALGLAVIKADGGAENAQAIPLLSDSRLLGEGAAVIGALVLGGLGLFILAKELGWKQLKQIRSFTLLILLITLILPMLSPFPVTMLHVDPLDYNNTQSLLVTGGFVALFFIIGAFIGIWWNPILWAQNAVIFYALFTVFYTTFFTNIDGFFTGIVGSLGYWLAQQSVERGSQPLYYYALIQLPIYEFIGLLGTALAVYFGIRYRRFLTLPGHSPASAAAVPDKDEDDEGENRDSIPGAPAAANLPTAVVETRLNPSHGEGYASAAAPVLEQASEAEAEEQTLPQQEAQAASFYRSPRPQPVLGLLVYWSLINLIAFSIAGERMPWLTVHITMGFLLTAGWGLGFLVDTTDWKRIFRSNGLLAVLLIPVLFASLAGLAGSLLGVQPPFQGNTLEQLQSTSQFLISGLAALATLAAIVYLLRDFAFNHFLRLATVVFFVLMAALTARAAYRASFINYDYATEYLVYAHAAPGPKQVLAQVEEISRRVTGGKAIQVAYSNDALYPYWWYLRDYPNHRWFQSEPTRDLRDFPIIIAGEDVYSKIEPIVGDEFYMFEYIRLWWPNQDYYGLTWERIWEAISNPEMRAAVFDIWLNRDYSAYAKLTNKTRELSPEEWSPSARMRLYIRKDIASQIWNYGASPAAAGPVETDPYADKIVQLSPAQMVGSTGNQQGQLQAPRGLAVAADGSIYVADSRNHRIQHFSADGAFLQAWGAFADSSSGNAPDGFFNEPWGLAVGPDGSVYVTDTWNHRVQKFTADGQFITKWGYFGQAETPDAFWGPRGIVVDENNRVYVVDTGNKRVVIFDANGNFITQFGTPGFGEGQFDEPVGIAIDQYGLIYIADTWNLRVQVFERVEGEPISFIPVRSWDIAGWEGQSLDNKPFIAVSPVNNHVFVTDPDPRERDIRKLSRVLEFDQEGNFVRGWSDFADNLGGFIIASGIATAPDGSLWVSDGAENILYRFELPAEP